MAPLSHHEILARVGPLTRAGRTLDLAASDRAARRLAFRPREHAGEPPLRESLVLDLSGRPRLVRTLTAPDGLQARLEAEGEDLALLLAQVEAVPPERQFRRLAGAEVALQHRLAADGSPRLRGAEARRPEAVLTMTLTGVEGYPAELVLAAADGARFTPPGDLFAVLGRGWTRLQPVGRTWQGSVRLRGDGAARSAAAEAALETALTHLQHTLAAPPAAFHARHRAARWAVVARESVPLMVCLAMVDVGLLLQRLGPEQAGWLGLLANMAPPLLMGAFFLRREMPVFGWPRPPRTPAPDAWSPR